MVRAWPIHSLPIFAGATLVHWKLASLTHGRGSSVWFRAQRCSLACGLRCNNPQQVTWNSPITRPWALFHAVIACFIGDTPDFSEA